ncbi:MAG: hypothetical protein SF028_11485 [Candidatus Sumerlaeia bacterium]|nr:hypothetical protein [Candidatus Sumerlaeia bacterium]
MPSDGFTSAEGMVGWSDGSVCAVINSPSSHTSRIVWLDPSGTETASWESLAPLYLRTIKQADPVGKDVFAVGASGGAGGDEDRVAVVRVAPSGLVWSSELSGPGYDYGYAVSPNIGGDLLAVGGFTQGGIAGAPAGRLDCFLAVYSAADGTQVLATQFGSAEDDRLFNAAPHPDGGWVLSGDTLGSLYPLATPEDLGGQRDIFVARAMADGSIHSGAVLGSVDDDLAFDSATDGAGRFYLTGQTRGAFDPSGGAPPAIAIFLLALDSNLQLAWRRQTSRPEGGFAESLAINDSGEPVLLFANQGQYPGFTQSDLASRTSEDAVLARYSAEGLLLQLVQLDTTTERIYPRAVVVAGERFTILRDRAAVPGEPFLVSDVLRFVWSRCDPALKRDGWTTH